MRTVFIDPQPDGTAVFELDGLARPFPSCWAAVAESRRLGLACKVSRFPPLSVQVVAGPVAPAAT